ncbi:MAG: helix-turn-helix domain-containing protein, partial [Erysipelotrichaceae bacterium]|nr:helix-turn-helix domain-containing protein [Erysipelotrichaceae bacterium]
MKTISNKLLIKTIKDKRKELHLSQSDLSDKTGINRAMISKIENNTYNPSLEQLLSLQKVLDFDINDILEEDKDNTVNKENTINKKYKIAVAGTGYVGMSIAVLLAQNHTVKAVDIIKDKVDKINKRISPIQDDYLEDYLANKKLDLVATLDGTDAYRDADYVVIAAPTNYDPKKN